MLQHVKQCFYEQYSGKHSTQSCKYILIFLWLVSTRIINFDYLINCELVNFIGGSTIFKKGEINKRGGIRLPGKLCTLANANSNIVFKIPSIHFAVSEKKLKLLLIFSFHVSVTLTKDRSSRAKSEIIILTF